MGLIAILFFQGRLAAQWVILNTNATAFSSTTNAVATDALGNVYTGGNFVNDSSHTYVARYDGTTWTELGGFNSLPATGAIVTICTDKLNNVYAAGQLSDSLGKYGVYKYNGSVWSKLGADFNDIIFSLCTDTNGNIYVSGAFYNDSLNRYVARFDGTQWTEVGGANALAANSGIQSICTDPAGNLYAAGGFTNDSNYMYVAKYDGTSWSQLGGPYSLRLSSSIHAVCTDKNGNVYAGGMFNIAGDSLYVVKYNGTSWTRIYGVGGPHPSSNDVVYSLCTDNAGNLFISGSLLNSSNSFVDKYTGSGWSELDFEYGATVTSSCTDTKGNLYIGGLIPYNTGIGTTHGCVLEYEATANAIVAVKPAVSMYAWPNPATDYTTLQACQPLANATLRVTDLNGQTVIEQNNLWGTTCRFDISQLPAGVYFAEIRQGENVMLSKVVKLK